MANDYFPTDGTSFRRFRVVTKVGHSRLITSRTQEDDSHETY